MTVTLIFTQPIIFLERKSAVSCEKVNITTTFTTNNVSTNPKNTAFIVSVRQLLREKCKDLGEVSLTGQSYQTQSLTMFFKFTPNGDTITSMVGQSIQLCLNNIETELKQGVASLAPKLVLPVEQRFVAKISWSSESCCSTSSKYCCPAGSLVRSTGGMLANVVCCK